jgi:CRP-like cAMP-binding protein
LSTIFQKTSREKNEFNPSRENHAARGGRPDPVSLAAPSFREEIFKMSDMETDHSTLLPENPRVREKLLPLLVPITNAMNSGLHNLHSLLKQYVQIEDEAWQDMQSRLKNRTYKKRDIFIKEGNVCTEIAFITRGSFRYYTVIDGVEITTYFSFEQEWLSSYSSFLSNGPSLVSVEAMQDAEMLVLGKADLQELYGRYLSIEHFGRYMAEHLVTCLDSRMHSLLLKTPEERYLKVLNETPEYFEKVPLHYIASFLGIAPESLSRIRRRLMQRVS